MAGVGITTDMPSVGGLGMDVGRRVSPLLIVGIAGVAGTVLIAVAGPLFIGAEGLKLGAGPYGQPPTVAHLLGTDATGRDVLTLVVRGLLPTIELGLLAGGLGTLLGALLGLVSGFVRGPLDAVVRTMADVAITIPPLALLVVVSAVLRTQTIELMAVIIGLTAWPYPTRAIRAQTLTLRERGFVAMARLSGRSGAEIAFLEILPNLVPYVAASFVGAVSGSILAAVALQLLGLGPITTPTLGLVLQYAFEYAAVIRGMWWWWMPPALVLIVLFVSLYALSVAIDVYVNPRLRRGGVDR
jgi:peptide/nickel transport system permease protein